MSEIFGNSMQLMLKSMDFLWKKQEVIANNIANGICVALPAYVLLKYASGRRRELSPVMYILVAVCVLYFWTLV